jgi:hypothetical protein
MTPDTFAQVTKSLLTKCSNVRNTKKVEYADGTDRLSNFNNAAMLNSVSVPEAIQGMRVKHTVSIADMIRDEFRLEDKVFSMKQWEEKIIDDINYLVLLYAGIIEEKGSDNE